MYPPFQFVGVIAVNAASIKPLFSASNWLNSSKGTSSGQKGTGYINKYGYPLATIGGAGGGSNAPTKRHHHHHHHTSEYDNNSSEEHIVKMGEPGQTFNNDIRAESTSTDRTGPQEGIVVTTTYEVSQYKSYLHV